MIAQLPVTFSQSHRLNGNTSNELFYSIKFINAKLEEIYIKYYEELY